MIEISFPNKYIGHGNIGEIHYNFAKNMISKFKHFNLIESNINSKYWPSFKINNKIITFDYNDKQQLLNNLIDSDLYLKTQYTNNHDKYKNVYPWSQISFFDWEEFKNLKLNIKYTANTNKILNNQKPYGNAIERRLKVRETLMLKYGNDVSIKHLRQNDFLNQINNCLVYVHVPGYSNNMIDRSHVQMFALGCCVITTYIPNILPNGLQPIENIHYIKCKDDYSDLIDKIEWCKVNRDKCIHIGNNAAILFNQSLSLEAMELYLINILKSNNII